MSTKAQRKTLINKQKTFLKSRSSFNHALNKKRMDAYQKRARAASRFQERVNKKGLKALGYDTDLYEKRLAAEVKLLDKERKELRKMVLDECKDRKKASRRNIKLIRASGKRFEWVKGNPVLTVCDWYAEAIDYFGTADNVSITNTSETMGNAGENVAKVTIDADTSRSTNSEATWYVQHHFIWDSDRQGILNAVAWADLIGSYDVRLNPSCFDNPYYGLTVDTSLSVRQQVTGTTETEIVYSHPNLLDLYAVGHCVGEVYAGAIGFEHEGIESEVNNFPLQANKPVLATVTTSIQLIAGWGASARVDFGSQSAFEINVPTIWFIISS